VKRVLLLAAALFCAAPAHAYVQSKNSDGHPMSWSTHGHNIQIDAQGSPEAGTTAVFDAIRKSFATWAAVSCSDLTFPEESLSTDPKARVIGFFPGQTNHNLVLFRSRSCQQVAPAGDPCFASGGCDNVYDCFDENLKGGVIATTTTTTNRNTGEIIDTDTEFNEAPNTTDGSHFIFTAIDGPPCAGPTDTGCVQFDVQNTMTHEAGHTLGLDHTPDPRATMFATSPSGETSKRILGQDDINGICAIYPKGAGSGGGCDSSPSQTGPGAALCALLFLLQISRRSRRKPQLAIRSRVASARSARFAGGSES
jgi:Matrixin